MPLKQQSEIILSIEESARRLNQTREAAEALRGAQAQPEATVTPRPVAVVTPPPSPAGQRQR